MFNPDLLIELIKKAQGNRSLNAFARQCGIDAGNLSRILNNKNVVAPKPDTLQKIASQSYNDVTYEDLMIASGYMTLSEDTANEQNIVPSKIKENDIEKEIEDLQKRLMNNEVGLMLSGDPASPGAVKGIIEALSLVIKQGKIINDNSLPQKK